MMKPNCFFIFFFLKMREIYFDVPCALLYIHFWLFVRRVATLMGLLGVSVCMWAQRTSKFGIWRHSRSRLRCFAIDSMSNVCRRLTRTHIHNRFNVDMLKMPYVRCCCDGRTTKSRKNNKGSSNSNTHEIRITTLKSTMWTQCVYDTDESADTHMNVWARPQPNHMSECVAIQSICLVCFFCVIRKKTIESPLAIRFFVLIQHRHVYSISLSVSKFSYWKKNPE